MKRMVNDKRSFHTQMSIVRNWSFDRFEVISSPSESRKKWEHLSLLIIIVHPYISETSMSHQTTRLKNWTRTISRLFLLYTMMSLRLGREIVRMLNQKQSIKQIMQSDRYIALSLVMIKTFDKTCVSFFIVYVNLSYARFDLIFYVIFSYFTYYLSIYVSSEDVREYVQGIFLNSA